MSKIYDLEERTSKFASDCRRLIRSIKLDLANLEDAKQLARSSGSIAANYIEANEALSKKDFIFRVKISRKESKESALWLGLLMVQENDQVKERERLKAEAMELVKIFTAIISKSE